jgi:hypothetical protein
VEPLLTAKTDFFSSTTPRADRSSTRVVSVYRPSAAPGGTVSAYSLRHCPATRVTTLSRVSKTVSLNRTIRVSLTSISVGDAIEY